ncbi:ISAs1 family transposase, partial [Pseudoalteromonas piscicida]
VQVKANQKTLYKAVTSCFETAFEEERNLPEDVQVSGGHGRQETRITYALNADNLPEEIREKWPGLTSLVAVERHKKSKSITKIDTHFYVTSVEPDAQMLQKAIRHHWHIENQQHWVLDVVFKEDACQISEPISAENMALFRRVVRNLVKQHTGRKDSIRGKCVRASFDDEFRAELIFG